MDSCKLAALFLALLCTVVHGFEYPDVYSLSGLLHGSTRELSLAVGRGLRGLRNLHKGVQKEVLDGTFFSRRILQEPTQEQTLCVWDGGCWLSDWGLSLVVTDSDSEIAQLVKGTMGCQAEDTEEGCVAKDCLWKLGECDLGPTVLNSTTDDCYGDLTPMYRIRLSDELCRGRLEEVDCNVEDGCFWNSQKTKCEIDIWKALLDVPTENGEPPGLQQAIDALRISWDRDVPETARSDLDPEFFRTWVPPKFKCPKGVDKRVCRFLQPSRGVIGRVLYCSQKYPEGGPMCDEDPICEDNGGECIVSVAVKAEIAESQIRVIYANLVTPETLDKLIPGLTCGVYDKSTCSNACEWDAIDLSCFLSPTWLAIQLGEETKNSSNLMCRAFSAYVALGCIGLNKTTCSEMSKCVWSGINGQCLVSEEETMKLIIASDPDLHAGIQIQEECTLQKNEKACLDY